MKITKDNFYEKVKNLLCAQCRSQRPEYFFDDDESPLCQTCTFQRLKNECDKLREINDLDNEDDVDLANKLWKEQEHQRPTYEKV